MRLLSLTLEHYGIFQAQRIAFDPAPGRINLLIAPNGAGKSILRNAFCDLLFGIHGQTPMGFRYGYGRMRLMAEAVAPDGAPLAVRPPQGTRQHADRRRRRHARSRRAGRPCSAIPTGRWSSGCSRSTPNACARAAGNCSHPTVRWPTPCCRRRAACGARARCSSRWSMRATRWHRCGARKGVRSTNISTACWMRASAWPPPPLKPEMREKQETERAHLQAEQEQQNKVAQAASQRIARLERIRRIVGVLAEYDAAAAWLAAHPDAPDLPANAGERLTKAQDDLLRAEQFLDRERRNREQSAEQLTHIAFDETLLAHGDAIEQLIDRAGAARQAMLDIPKREAEHALTNDRIAGILRQLGSTLPPDQASEAVPPRAAVLLARRLGTAHARLRAALAQLPAELAQAETDFAATEAALAALPAVTDTRGLARLVREIRSAGEPDRRALEAQQAVAAQQAKLTDAVARVRGWSHGATALIALPVMPAETYERLHAAFASAEAAVATCDRNLAELRNTVGSDRQRLRAIAAGQPIPDEPRSPQHARTAKAVGT